jgi:hypothetical protein
MYYKKSKKRKYIKNNKYNKYNKYNKSSSKKKYTKKRKGGKVLASGGFGCVFKPALLCENETTRTPNSISKLMIKTRAIKEKTEIDSLYLKLSQIKHFKDYFLISNIKLCNPKPLTQADLKSFNPECTALQKKKMTSENINKHLSELLMLTMPDGGLPVDDFLINNNDFKSFQTLNNSLMDLLLNGIIPMNQLFIFHGDIKDSNILVEIKNDRMYTRLIDWGLTCSYKPSKFLRIPPVWFNRPFQYNLPYSNILLSDIFFQTYASFHSKNPDPIDTEMDNYVHEFITILVNNRGAGHLFLMNKIINILTDNKLTKETIHFTNDSRDISKQTEQVIVRYISEILLDFHSITPNGTFDLHDYINKVYIFNLDIWGFVITYYPVLELLYNNHNKLTEQQLFLFENIKNLFKYIIECASNPIDTNTIIKYLTNMNNISDNSFSFKNLSITSSSGSKDITGDTYAPE